MIERTASGWFEVAAVRGTCSTKQNRLRDFAEIGDPDRDWVKPYLQDAQGSRVETGER